MCGIVGYIGRLEAQDVILNGLKKLEYRGYDSAGVAIWDGSCINIERSVGKLVNLDKVLAGKPLRGHIGIGHTRWATHGKPSEQNAHPHMDCKRELVVVHNGIIENYIDLKEMLLSKGHVFKSETDTEVVVHLIEDIYSKNADLSGAVIETLNIIRGSYALVIFSKNEPDKIICARNLSPLVVGVTANETIVASDIPALLNYTRDVVFLDDNEMAVITAAGIKYYGIDSIEVQKKTVRINWDPISAEKGGFKHFMLKEIFEQPRAIEDTFRGRILDSEGEVFLEDLVLKDEDLDVDKIYIIACGTSYHAALVGKFMIEELSGVSVEVDLGSEFRYRKPVLNKKHLVLVISQSGETADTIAAAREAKKWARKVISVCNVVGSSIARETDGVVYTHAGPEIGVASTKAFTTQLVALLLFAIHLGRRKNVISAPRASELFRALRIIPRQIEEILAKEMDIEAVARKYFKKTNFLYLGRNVNYPIALEGALKLKEISYIHAEGYPAGEMKHGPIALIDENLPVVVIAFKDRIYEKILGNLEEVKARDGIIIAVTGEDCPEVIENANEHIIIPGTDSLLSPLLSIIPLQLLAYHIAVRRGCDVDQPRNLAKSVTVE